MESVSRPDPSEEPWEEEHPTLPFEDPAVDGEGETDESTPRS